ncbi:MAG: amino acid ABC transporter substrate-binding protein, partial [Clostridiales bacterium]|nr:amino acid ABC transporter substrate-binding protein [Clostridiales bacterium]
MKKFLASALSAALLLSALAGCSGSGSGSASGSAPAGSGASNGDKVVKIGVFEPASGDSASGGKKEMLGMQFANSETPTVELGGEPYQVELVYADNGSSTDKAPSAASQLVSEGVSVVLGSYGSGVSMAGGKVFEEAGIPAIGIGCTNPQVTSDCSVYFRVCFLDPFQGTVHANYAFKEMGATKAYTLAMLGSDYDQGLVYYFSEAFKGLGGEVVSEDFPEGNANFVSYINNAMADGADVIFCPVSTNYAQLIIEAAAAQGFKGAILGTDTVDNNMVLESAKGK